MRRAVVCDATPGTEWLIDRSALARLGASVEAARLDPAGIVRIATVTLLEVGYSARDATDLATGLRGPPVSSMPIEYAPPIAEDRAVNVLTLLADRGQHRARSVPDLLVAAIAESAGLIVLHNDNSFKTRIRPRAALATAGATRRCIGQASGRKAPGGGFCAKRFTAR